MLLLAVKQQQQQQRVTQDSCRQVTAERRTFCGTLGALLVVPKQALETQQQQQGG
jgi:hypothetical protein